MPKSPPDRKPLLPVLIFVCVSCLPPVASAPDATHGRRTGDSRGQSSRPADRRQRPDRCFGV